DGDIYHLGTLGIAPSKPQLPRAGKPDVSKEAGPPLPLVAGVVHGPVATVFEIAVLLALGLADTLDGNDLLVRGGLEYPHALGGSLGEPDAVDRHADQLSAIGNQHQLIGLVDREGRDQRPDLVELVEVGGLDALAAAVRRPEVVRGRN